MPRVMHRKMTFYRNFFLSNNLRSATLVWHAKAPGCRQRVVTRRGRDRFFGLRFGQPSGSGDSGPRDVGPGDLGSPSGAPVVRRDRRGPLRWTGVALGGSPPITTLLRRSGRRGSGDHALGLPATVASPPCAGAAARSGEESFRRLRTAGCFGGLRDPTGFFGTLAESSRSHGNLGVA